jgi:hypothetical protein
MYCTLNKLMKTFKQFLAESLPSPNNVDQKFNVGNVAFDNKDGLGATPMDGLSLLCSDN